MKAKRRMGDLVQKTARVINKKLFKGGGKKKWPRWEGFYYHLFKIP